MGEGRRVLALDVVPGRLAVARLGPGEAEPGWARGEGFVSVTRTPGELSIVCEEASLPDSVEAERGYRRLAVRGPLAFAETGILAALCIPLAAAGVPLFVLSTHDTDHLLVPEAALPAAAAALRGAGHGVHGG